MELAGLKEASPVSNLCSSLSGIKIREGDQNVVEFTCQVFSHYHLNKFKNTQWIHTDKV